MESFINFKDQVCLITGAGSETGIGFNAAKILGGLGGRIALVATTAVSYTHLPPRQKDGWQRKSCRRAAEPLDYPVLQDPCVR